MSRFLTPELTKLLTEYLAIVRPLEIWFAEEFHLKGADDLKDFLWADYKKGVWDGDDLSNLIKSHTVGHNMRPLGLLELRQVITAFMETHIRYKVVKDEQEGVNIFNLQAGHNDLTTNLCYAVATGDSRIVTREKMHLFRLASEEWQQVMRNKHNKRKTNGMKTIARTNLHRAN